MSLKETYNLIAEDWHRDHQKDDWWVEGTDRFVSLLPPGALVLDVGCAGGVKSRYLIAKGLKIVGIDLSEKMIEIAKREVPEGTFLALDLDKVGALEYEFNGIFMQAVLLHIPKKVVLEKLGKLIQKLKPGGYLYVAVKEKREGGPEEETQTENDYGYSYERFFSFFTADEIEAHLRALSLEIVLSEVKVSGNTNWIQVIGKK